MLAFAVADPVAAEPLLDGALAARRTSARSSRSAGRSLCAVVDAAGADPVELARRLRADLRPSSATSRAAASRRSPAPALRRAFHEARCALEAVRFANGNAPDVASYRDLGSFQLLLSLQDDEALRSTATACSGRSRTAAPTTPTSCCARSTRSSSTTATGSARRAGLLPPPHAALPDPPRRGADRARPGGRDRIEFWLALRGRELEFVAAPLPSERELVAMKVGSPDRDQGRRVPRRADARRRARADAARPRGARPGRRRRRQRDRRPRLRGAGRADRRPTRPRSSATPSSS